MREFNNFGKSCLKPVTVDTHLSRDCIKPVTPDRDVRRQARRCAWTQAAGKTWNKAGETKNAAQGGVFS